MVLTLPFIFRVYLFQLWIQASVKDIASCATYPEIDDTNLKGTFVNI